MKKTPAAEGPLSAEPVELAVDPAEAELRLDTFLAIHFTDYSRGHLRRVITAGGVEVDGRGSKPAYRLRAGQRVRVVLPEIPRQSPRPENIPLDILYQDDELVVVNKPPGMVVHPARGHWSGTLAGALQFHFGPGLSGSGGPTRPGIVHRLDRDTSGVILVARTDRAHLKLAAQFQHRTIEKEYFAIVAGRPELDRDVIDRAIGVHPQQREKMAILRDAAAGRTAQTFYQVQERFDGFATLAVLPKTGRTHQIRVHLSHIGCPVLCDRQYGGRAEITRGEIRRDPGDGLVLLARQALHARRLRLVHPVSGQVLEVEAPLPADLAGVLAELREYRGPGTRGQGLDVNLGS
jgi:23S rRNA pseudouridine1911/1915/1917 synthase